MASKSSSTIAQEVRSILRQRVGCYQLILLDNITPLFQKEPLHATRLHEEALQRPDPTSISKEKETLDQLIVLDNLDEQLTVHWTELHSNLVSRTALLADIFGYQKFLTVILLLDYAGTSQNEADSWVSDRLEDIDKYNRAMDRSAINIKMYQQTVAQPLKELMIDQSHVENRLRLAAAVPSYPTGGVYHLIDRCDWPNLAAMLIKDHELAVALFSGKPLDPQLYNDHISKLVLQKMDELKDRYFAYLSTPSVYTISKRAKKLTTKKAGQPTKPTPLPSGQHLSPATIQHSEEPSAIVAARNIYNRVLGGLGFGERVPSLRSIVRHDSATPSPRVSLDSTSPLIDSRKKDE